MTMKLCDGGSAVWATGLENGAGTTEPTLCRLFTNDFTPTDTSTFLDFTEAVYDGYGSQNLTRTPVLTSIGAGLGTRSTYQVLTFVATDSLIVENIYGYFVTDALNNLLWSERFASAPFVMVGTFTPITIQAVFETTDQVANPIVVPDSGTLASVISDVAGWLLPLTLHLFKSNTTPTTATVLGDFTEADFDGYAAGSPYNLTGPVVTVPTPGSGALVTYTLINFTPTGSITPNNIYGYYVLDSAGTLLWCERAPSPPIVLNSTLTTLPLTIKFGAKSAF